jgi:hypothetical protein
MSNSKARNVANPHSDILTFRIDIDIDIVLIELALSRARAPSQVITLTVIVSTSTIDNTIHPLCTYHTR